MTLQIGDVAPDFEAETTQGRIHFHTWIGDSWCVLFSHPKDFTPVCTTELGTMARLKPEFDKRTVQDHRLERRSRRQPRAVVEGYRRDPGLRAELSDDRRCRSEGRQTLRHDPSACGRNRRSRNANDNATVRNVFVIGPDKKIKLLIVYPMSTGRNFDEVLRVVDSLQMTTDHKVATPANWWPGEDVIIPTSIGDEEAKTQFPAGWKTLRPYLRLTPAPR